MNLFAEVCKVLNALSVIFNTIKKLSKKTYTDDREIQTQTFVPPVAAQNFPRPKVNFSGLLSGETSCPGDLFTWPKRKSEAVMKTLMVEQLSLEYSVWPGSDVSLITPSPTPSLLPFLNGMLCFLKCQVSLCNYVIQPTLIK